MKFYHFFKKGFLLFLLFAIFLTLLSLVGIVSLSQQAAWMGLLIGFINFLIGAAILCWGSQKPDKIFYGAFFGGMLSRFFLIFFLLFILIKFKKFDQLILVGSLLCSYFGYLILEIWYIWKYS